MSIEVLNSYILICGIHGLIQSMILYKSNSENSTANKFLAVYIFSFSIILIENSLKIIDGVVKLPNFVSLPFLFCGHLLFFYSKTLFSKNITKNEFLMHSIPSILFLAIFIMNFLSSKIDIFFQVLSDTPFVNNAVINSLGISHMIIYLLLTKRVMKMK